MSPILLHVGETGGEDNQLRQYLVTNPQNWTWVVLQEQSQLGAWADLAPEWETHSRNAAITLDQMIEATGGDTIFFMTWGRRDGDDVFPDFLSMNRRLGIGYERYVAATSRVDRPTKVAPVGLAFQHVYEQLARMGMDPTTPGSDFL